MVDEGGRPEPELGTVLAGGVHDAEVVLAVAQQHVLLALRELGDAAHQILDLVVSFPAAQSSVSAGEQAGGGGHGQTPQAHHAFVATILAPFCSEE